MKKRLLLFYFFLPTFAFVNSAFSQAKPPGQVEWEKTVQAAKKEGQLNVYIGSPWDLLIQAGVFQKAYPEVKVTTVAGRGGHVAQRIVSERRAGKYLADVVVEGVTATYDVFYQAKMLDPITHVLIVPEVVDESKWWGARHSYSDPEARYIFRFVGTPSVGGAYFNTSLVDPRDFKSVWDFLNPKWKGKIEVRDIRVPGFGGGSNRFLYYHPEIGPSFIRRLIAEMDVMVFRDFRQGTDWLAQGRFAICFFCPDIARSKRQGLPVDAFGPMKEGAGLSTHFGTVALINRAPHPHAAKVFINWLLSRQGQITLQRALAGENAPDSLRIDIPKDDVAPENRRIKGVGYLDLDTEGRRSMEPVLRNFEEALAAAGKR